MRIEELKLYDHIKLWAKESRTVAEDCQLLCKADNLRSVAH